MGLSPVSVQTFVASLSLVPASVSVEASHSSEHHLSSYSSTFTGAYVPGQVLVKFKNNRIALSTFGGRSQAENFAVSYRLGLEENISEANVSRFSTETGESVEQTVARLKNDTSVDMVEPDYIRTIGSIVPNNPDFTKQWALHNVGQTITSYNNGTTVASSGSDIGWMNAMDIFSGSTV